MRMAKGGFVLVILENSILMDVCRLLVSVFSCLWFSLGFATSAYMKNNIDQVIDRIDGSLGLNFGKVI